MPGVKQNHTKSGSTSAQKPVKLIDGVKKTKTNKQIRKEKKNKRPI